MRSVGEFVRYADRVPLPLLPVAAAACAASLGIRADQTARAGRRIRGLSAGGVPAIDEATPVRILQPIRSGDPRLPAHLAAMRRACPSVPIEWLVDDDDAAAVDVCRAVAAHAAEVGLPAPELVTSPAPPAGVNPKSWKLARRIRVLAGAETLVVVDDDTVLSGVGLAALLGGLADGATVATGLPRYERQGTLAARLVADWVNGQAITTYLGLPGEPLSINGMCFAIRVATLRRLGGFEAIERIVVDDLALAGLVRAAGGSIHQTATPQRIGTEVPDVRALAVLLLRWMAFANLAVRRLTGRDRLRMLGGLAAPPLLLAVGLAGFAAVARRRPVLAAVGATASLGTRTLLLELGWRSVGEPLPASPLGAIAMELLAPLVALVAAARPTITWRGRRLRLRADGTIEA